RGLRWGGGGDCRQGLGWDEPGTARIPVLHRNPCSLGGGSNRLRAMDLELEMVLAHARRLQRADHTYSNITVPVTVSPSSRRSAAGCPHLFHLASPHA